MSPTRIRLLALLAVVGAVAVVVVTQSDESARPTRSRALPGAIRKCQDLPERAALPVWFPKELVLPAGTYASTQELPDQGSYRRAILAVKASLPEFITHTKTQWTKAGWILAVTDIEPGESESTFVNNAAGLRLAYSALSSFCDETWTWVYVVLGSGG